MDLEASQHFGSFHNSGSSDILISSTRSSSHDYSVGGQALNEDITQPISETIFQEPAVNRPCRKPNIFALWIVEIAVLLLAVGVLIAIIIILNTYRYQRLPNWGSTINLNALIAILSTVFRACIGFVAFEIISQLKWEWLSTRARSVHDLQLFDDASRGVYGSLRLSSLVITQQPITLAAIAIIVTSLAIGPFVQQATQTYQCLRQVEVGGEEASIRIAYGMGSDLLTPFHNSFSDVTLRQKMLIEVQDSIINPSLSSNIGSIFKCETGYCSFPAYSTEEESHEDRISHASLGICSRCEDTSELVSGPFNDNTTRNELRLPTAIKGSQKHAGVVLEGMGEYLGIQTTEDFIWAEKVLSYDFLARSQWSVSNFSMVVASSVPCERQPDKAACPVSDHASICGPIGYTAATCIIYPCLKYYRGIVGGNELSEIEVRDIPLYPSHEPRYTAGYPWTAVQQPCIVNGTLYTMGNMSKIPVESSENVTALDKDFANNNPNKRTGYTRLMAPPECVFKLDSDFMQALMRYFGRIFNARCASGYSPRQEMICENMWKEDVSFIAALKKNCSTDIKTIQDSINSLTLRLTRELRLTGRGPYHLNATGAAVQGEMLESTLCLEVFWRWLILPISLCLICITLLVCTLVKNSSQNTLVWKSSLIPFLLKDNPEIWTTGLLGIQQTAKEYWVQLLKNSDSGTLEIFQNVKDIQLHSTGLRSREND